MTGLRTVALLASVGGFGCGSLWGPRFEAAPLATLSVRWRALTFERSPRLAMVWFGSAQPAIALEVEPQSDRPLELLAEIDAAPPDEAFSNEGRALGALVAFDDADADGVLGFVGESPDAVIANAWVLPRASTLGRRIVLTTASPGLRVETLDGGLADEPVLHLDADGCVEHGWFARRDVVGVRERALDLPPLRLGPCP